MCIRDSLKPETQDLAAFADGVKQISEAHARVAKLYFCLLYTSDAADERSSVDLGGRRIIKQKTPIHHIGHHRPPLED